LSVNRRSVNRPRPYIYYSSIARCAVRPWVRPVRVALDQCYTSFLFVCLQVGLRKIRVKIVNRSSVALFYFIKQCFDVSTITT
jgi:hypothetical protein